MKNAPSGTICSALRYPDFRALLVLRGAGRQGRPVAAPQPAMADAVPAR